MSHKTMINGTLYEIDKGKSLVEGTIREIDHGKTLVGGTAYEVGFAPSTANVRITTPDNTNASFPNIIINGVNYNDTNTTYELVVPIGTVVEVGGYYLNDTHVSGNYTIMGDVEIQRYTHVTPPSGPPFTPTVTVKIIIVEL